MACRRNFLFNDLRNIFLVFICLNSIKEKSNFDPCKSQSSYFTVYARWLLAIRLWHLSSKRKIKNENNPNHVAFTLAPAL